MDQKKIGAFLKALRKEKSLTQEELAEKFGVAGRTVSRWETGVNMPDISLLVELAEFYDVSIPEIIDGERHEIMNTETKETAAKMAQFSKNETKTAKRKTVGTVLAIVGAVIIAAALATFPTDSSWGSNYSILGSIILLVGLCVRFLKELPSTWARVGLVVGVIVALTAFFTLTDWLVVTQSHGVPRFAYYKSYGDNGTAEYRTPFFTVEYTDDGENMVIK